MSRSEFDVWLERKARANPNNPLYAHVLKGPRIDSLEVGRENMAKPVPQEKEAARPASVAKAAAPEVPAKDFKQESSDHDDNDVWDGYEG